MIAQVILNSTSRATDNIYHYIVPEEFQKDISVGMRVETTFGRGNKPVEAYVIGFTDDSDYKNLKPILKIIDYSVYFDESDVSLVIFMKHRYFCTYCQALKTIMPSGVNLKFSRLVFLNDCSKEYVHDAVKNSLLCSNIVDELQKCSPLTVEKLTELTGKRNVLSGIKKLEEKNIVTTELVRTNGVKDSTSLYVSLSIDRDDAYELCDVLSKRAPAQARALEMIADSLSISLSELCEFCSVSKSTVDALVKKGYTEYKKEVTRGDFLKEYSVSECVRKTLTPTQKQVVEKISQSIDKNNYHTYLIHGVTGSGKTEVYLNLIEKTIEIGRQAILLVPEISLTPQMVSQVVSRFSGRVAVLHSSLTVKQRYDEWKKIKDGEVDVAVGARSAIFAPFNNIGLIIVDEEHENTYKSEQSPRYNAVEIARFRSNQYNSTLVLASATPSVDSYYKAMMDKYTLLEMNSRIGDVSLPEVEIVDMRKELQNGNMNIFSSRLIELIRNNIDSGRQTMLFLNRRGYSNAVSCRNCGYVMKCPHCNVSLTYHKTKGKMICHYCDYMTDLLKKCPSCDSKYIKHFGTGTQKVAETVEKLFPDATYLRMDADTTSERTSHERILKKFKDENINILIGTQMITKGLDFQNVTLVGVLAADMSLNQEDFRAGERTFDLITQVCGRSGRGKYPGTALIQTYNPDDETIILSAKQDYKSFYNKEIEFRKMLVYPPFCEFINITFTDSDEEKAQKTSKKFYQDLLYEIKNNNLKSCIEVFEPVKSPIYFINDKFRYRILAKTKYNKELYDVMGNLYKKFSGDRYCGVIIDVNPHNLY